MIEWQNEIHRCGRSSFSLGRSSNCRCLIFCVYGSLPYGCTVSGKKYPFHKQSWMKSRVLLYLGQTSVWKPFSIVSIRFHELQVGSVSVFIRWVWCKLLSVGQFPIAIFDHCRASCDSEGIKDSLIHILFSCNLCHLCSGSDFTNDSMDIYGLCQCENSENLRRDSQKLWRSHNRCFVARTWVVSPRLRLLFSPTLPKVLVLSTVGTDRLKKKQIQRNSIQNNFV